MTEGGGGKRRNPIESARELPEPQLTFLSGSEYKYHADIWAMICVRFLFFFMVLSWNSKGFVPEHAAHCTSVDQKERKKQQRTEIELQQHAAQHMHRNYSNAQGKFESKSVYLHTVFLYQYACQHFVQPIPRPAIGTITNETGFVPQGSR